MSLQLAAQHLAAKGRGPDTTLVHMAPQEVAGLQALARAHGGTLTTNPDTGLPEAGFLSSILPMIAGAALTATGVGAPMAALLVGGGTGLATGSLRKGLMAGLGAYGGAGLFGSVAGAGQSALQAAASAPAVAGTAPAVVAPAVAAPVTNAAQLAGTTGTNAIVGGTPGFQSLGGETLFSRPMAATPMSQIMQTATPAPAMAQVVDKSTYPLMDRLKAGISAIGEKPSEFLTKENMRYGMAALAPAMMQDQSGQTYQGSGPNPYRYSYNPGRVANPQRAGGVGEFNYFDPVYTRLADGGPVQEMSDRNQQEMFLTNGAQRFADGGEVTVPKYVFDPITNTLRDTTAIQPVRTVTKAPGRTTSDVGPYSDEENAALNTWGNLTPLEQATYYAQHPTMAAITQLGQGLFGMTSIGALQNAMFPDFVSQQQAIANPGPGGYLASMDYALAGMSPPVGSQGKSGSITGGLIPAIVGYQNPANVPVSDAIVSSNYDQGGFGAYGENVAPGASMGNDVIGFGSYGENVAPGTGVEVGGPISAGDVVGVDIGGIGSSIGDAVAGVSAADVAAADAASASADAAAADAAAAADGYARGGLSALYARGGVSHLGDYSDGGRLLRGPGDGVSDSIPATIANKRPARLADGEFVVPARIVSELGNGSTEAGARKLYAMMDRVQKSRGKTVGKGRVAVNSRADKHLPA